MKKHLLFLSFLWFLGSCMSKLSPSKENKNSEKITEYSEDLSVFRPKFETPQSTRTQITHTMHKIYHSKYLHYVCKQDRISDNTFCQI